MEEDNVSIKLIISKSKNIVCYAEAGEDFVNLLFSFLTLPLGFVTKQIQDGSLKGCIDQLYWSVQDLNAQYLKSNHHKEMLLNPKLVPGFCYNSLLGIEEASYYYLGSGLTTDSSLIHSNRSLESFKIEPTDHNSSVRGFLKGPAIFTVTDNLVIRPISTIFELSVLDELNVPFTDIEERVMLMGKKLFLDNSKGSNLYESVENADARHFQTEACREMLLHPHNGAESHCKNLKALRLLVTSFRSDSALTRVFLSHQRKNVIKNRQSAT
ncbi:unnamed protein product [Malus baccata var. baccata]